MRWMGALANDYGEHTSTADLEREPSKMRRGNAKSVEFGVFKRDGTMHEIIAAYACTYFKDGIRRTNTRW